MVNTGKGFTTIFTGADVAEHPLASVTVTVLFPTVFALMDDVVAPVLHNQLFPVEAVRVTDPPAQNVVGPALLMVGVGNELTVMVVGDDVAEHPFMSVMVTVLLPLVDTLIDCKVCPLLHV